MKIAVTSTGQTIDDAIDTRFGRCSYYLIVDADSLETEAIANENQAMAGAGIQSAQLLLNHDVDVVLTGNCGPNAFKVLEKGDVEVITGLAGPIAEAIQQYKAGSLKPSNTHNVDGHHGMGKK